MPGYYGYIEWYALHCTRVDGYSCRWTAKRGIYIWLEDRFSLSSPLAGSDAAVCRLQPVGPVAGYGGYGAVSINLALYFTVSAVAGAKEDAVLWLDSPCRVQSTWVASIVCCRALYRSSRSPRGAHPTRFCRAV